MSCLLIFKGIENASMQTLLMLPTASLTNLSAQIGSALCYTEVFHWDFFLTCLWGEKVTLETARVSKALRRNNLSFSCTLVKTQSPTSVQTGNTRQAKTRCNL